MKTKITLIASLFLATVIIVSCKKFKPEEDPGYSSTPVLPETPYDYQSSTNDHLATAGRVLFYDKSLSLNNSVSCASCHEQSKAFCDNLQFSTGLEDNKTGRNSPTIFAKSGRMFWDGRAASIQDLVLRPIKNHVEMKFDNLSQLADKISKIGYYQDLFQKAKGTSVIDSNDIRDALAEFVKNFNFSNNKFRRVEMGMEKLNASESIGRTVFFNKGKCSNCHHIEDPFPGGGNGTGYGFTNTDFNIGLDQVYSDNGSGAVTNNPSDNGKFMVPVLLNIEFTAPYMHDGRFKTLEEVVEHYNSGIKNHPNLDFNLRNTNGLDSMSNEQVLLLLDTNKDGEIDNNEVANGLSPMRLNLTEVEKRGLVDFLKTLSDGSIFIDKRFSDPFRKR